MSDESILEFFSEDYPLLIEAGFVAIKQSDEIAARRLFKAAEILNAENPISQIGLGYIALNKLQVTEAIPIFETVLKKDPENYLALAMLGVAYILAKDKRKKGEALIREAQEKSDDPTIKSLADTCLDWIKTDLSGAGLPPLKASLSQADEKGED